MGFPKGSRNGFQKHTIKLHLERQLTASPARPDQLVTNPVVPIGVLNYVTVFPTNPAMFYRLVATDPRAFAFVDYWPTDPNVVGNMTYRYQSASQTNYYTNAARGFISVSYRSGKIWGVRIGDPQGTGENGFYLHNDGDSVQWMGQDGWFASTDTNLTALPPAFRFSTVHDGWTEEVTYVDVKTDLSQSLSPWTTTLLVKINTVTVPWGMFTDAIVLWWIDHDYPFANLNLFGLDARSGLTLPTSSETGGYAITAFMVLGAHTGRILEADVSAASGTLVSSDDLMSVSHD
jgi:hypothetical protein